MYNSDKIHSNFTLVLGSKQKKKYLIHTPTCRILEQFSTANISHFFKKMSYLSCTDKQLLTYVEHRGSQSFLKVNQTVLNDYAASDIFCCLSSVTRVGDEKIE